MQDAAEKLLRLVQPLDYHLLLLVHVGSSGIARDDLECIKSVYRALGTRAKGMGPKW